MQQQQQQPYGFSNNYGQIQTRPMYQQQPMYQQYQQQPYGNNFDNDSHPFAPPAGYQNNVGVMRYQNQNYNQPQPQFQPGYPNYSSPEDEDRPPGETNYQQRNGIGPNNIGLGLELQNNAARRNSGDAFKPETTNQGGSSWNKAQPDQDSSSKKNDPKPSTSKAYNIRQYSRRMTSFGVSNKSGICLSIFGLGGTIGVLGVIIALMAYHFGKKDVTLTSVSGGLDYMVFNLNADPIMELSWASSSCPWGTETIHLGKWPGTGDGCNCAVTGLSSGQCNDNSDSLTSTVANAILCSDYSDIDSRDIYKWENNAVFCVKRAQLGVDYVKAPSCGTGYKTCSAGLCFLNSLSCPVTSVTFSNTGDSSSLLTTGKYVVVSRTSGAAPVIDFEASLNSWPCFSYNEIPKRNDGSKNGDYLLLKQRPKGCSKYGEDSLFSINIENKTQYDLLINNQFPSDVFKLPGYTSVLQGTTTLLTGRKRIDVNTQKDECLAIETETMNSAGDYAAKLNKYVSGTAITGMVLHSILVILVIVALCNLRAENGWKSALSGKEAGLWALPYVFFTFCELIVYIVMVALVKKARSHLIEAQEYLMGLDKLGCFPRGPPQLIIADYDEVVDDVASKLNGYAVALLALTILTFVPVIAILIYKSKKD